MWAWRGYRGQGEGEERDAEIREATEAPFIPQRLPTTSPMAELILDRPVWVRTEDGKVYPAPQDAYYGTSWGYAGSGPAALALMIHRLLDDITAQAADDIGGAPPTLELLTQVDLPEGTVLTREQLEAAREGRWRPSAEDGTKTE
jgi:hypothetical protein